MECYGPSFSKNASLSKMAPNNSILYSLFVKLIIKALSSVECACADTELLLQLCFKPVLTVNLSCV